MTRQDDLSDVYAELRELKRQIRVLSTAAPLGNSSITRGGLRIASPEGLTVQAVAGGIAMRVTGTEVVDGTLRVTGTFEMTGSTELTGPLTIAGATDITGDVDLTGDLNVVSSGRIKVGGMTLDPSSSGGSVKFGNGAEVFSDGSTIQLFQGNSVVQVENGYARIQNGGNVVEINPTGVRISLASVPVLTGTGLPVNTLLITGAGYLRRAG